VPQLICTANRPRGSSCSYTFNVECHPISSTETPSLRGTAICPRCHTSIGFELTNNIITWVSGSLSYGVLNAAVPPEAKAFYGEAELCLLAAAPNAVACLCRASVEIALEKAGYKRGSLYDKVEEAKKVSRLGDEEVGLAHASRLVTRESIHRGTAVQPSDSPSLLAAAVRVLNRLFP